MDTQRHFEWSHIRAFLATAENGSLSAAARVLGLTQPTLSRQVAALEEDLAVMLFERVGRSMRLTDAGRQLLDHARAMGEAADRLSLSATGQMQAVEGRVRITASDIMSAHVLPPALHRLREIAPKLEIDLVATNDIRDLMRREADIAIRHVRPDQPDLVARMVREDVGRFYAARSYLSKRGKPRSVADLARHDFISYGDVDRMIGFLADMGIPLTPANFRIGSENGLVAWALAREGFGISVMSEGVGQAADNMELLLPDHPGVKFPIWLVSHRELHTSRRIRLVFDLLADFLKRP